MQTESRYYVELTRFSTPHFVRIPYAVTKENVLSIAHQWMLGFLKHAVVTYTNHDEEQDFLFDIVEIHELIKWLNENEFYYHYEYSLEQASLGFLNPAYPSMSGYWEYFRYQLRLHLPENITLIRLHFPDIYIETLNDRNKIFP